MLLLCSTRCGRAGSSPSSGGHGSVLPPWWCVVRSWRVVMWVLSMARRAPEKGVYRVDDDGHISLSVDSGDDSCLLKNQRDARWLV